MEHIVFEVGLALTRRCRGPALRPLAVFGRAIAYPRRDGRRAHMPKLGIIDLRFIQSAPRSKFMGRAGILFLLFYLGLRVLAWSFDQGWTRVVVGGTIYIALNFGLGLGLPG